jgi:hypothetical protein
MRGVAFFDGTLSGTSINQGRHTLNAPGAGSISGSWTGTRVTTTSVPTMSVRGTASRLGAIAGALKR